ncbi:hypothetical protein N2152v2_009931 [Parachlorella kessleri]
MAKATVLLMLTVLGASMMLTSAVGFDGQVFEFHATGEFNLLATEEWKVDATFLDPYDGKGAEKKSLTSAVRVTAPTVTTVTADATFTAVMMPATKTQSVKLGQIEGSIATMTLPGLAQCSIHTPKYTLTVNHVSGAEQAARFPNVEGWAAKFTWLDTSFELKGVLNPPVTGILGATYPVKTPEDLLRAAATAEGVANVAGRRALQSGPTRGLPFTAGVEVKFGEVHLYGPGRRLAGSREA